MVQGLPLNQQEPCTTISQIPIPRFQLVAEFYKSHIVSLDSILVTEYRWKPRFSSMLTDHDFLPFPMRGLLREQRTKAWTWKTKRSEHWLDSVLPRVSTRSQLLKTQSCCKVTVHPPCFPSSWCGLENRDWKKLGIKRSGTFATDMVMNKTCHSCLLAAILNFKTIRSTQELWERGCEDRSRTGRDTGRQLRGAQNFRGIFFVNCILRELIALALALALFSDHNVIFFFGSMPYNNI